MVSATNTWTLKPILYKDVEQYDNDYYKRSKDVDIPEESGYYGVYRDEHLVSYFAVQDIPNDALFIRRGYVLPEYRGSEVWRMSLKLLEHCAKNKGYRSLEFASFRNPFAYMRLFKGTGFKPDSIAFKKYLGD